MTTQEKAKEIQHVDWAVQDSEDIQLTYAWQELVNDKYTYAEGSNYGWKGIAEASPEVIEELYPLVIEFKYEWM